MGDVKRLTEEKNRDRLRKVIGDPSVNVPSKVYVPKKTSDHMKSLLKDMLNVKERSLFVNLFEHLSRFHEVSDPAGLILLHLTVYDLIRAKRVQDCLEEDGMFYSLTYRDGTKVKKVHEANFLLNSLQTQIRNSFKEMLMTKRERVKAEVGLSGSDFAEWLKTPVITLEDETTKNEKVR